MARTVKTGLDYFPLDTELDDKFRLLQIKKGLVGFAIVIKLYQCAYREYGYFYPWTEEQKLLFCDSNKIGVDDIDSIIEAAVDCRIFDVNMYEKGYLTSIGIQKRFLEITKKRKDREIYSSLLLLRAELIPPDVGINSAEPGLIPPQSGINRQRKEKERKEKESKEKEKETEIMRPSSAEADASDPEPDIFPKPQDKTDPERTAFEIFEAFFVKCGGDYSKQEWGRERKQTHALVARVRAREPDGFVDLAVGVCKMFAYLKRSRDKAFADKNYRASVLNLDWVWNRVMALLTTTAGAGLDRINEYEKELADESNGFH